MNQTQTAAAYQHAYQLFSQLWLQGLTPELWPYVQAVPELAVHFTAVPDFENAAAVHQNLFGFNIHAHESFFLGEDGLLGGDITAAVQHTYEQIGYTAIDAADHIGRELAALAFLCAAESEAWTDNLPHIARQMRAKQLLLLQNHLLRWLWPFVQAVQEHQEIFYSALAVLLRDLVTAHTHQLISSQPLPPAIFTLPAAPAILEDSKTGLNTIANYLVTPVYSGLYLSRDTIGRIARRFDLPRGFGGRQQMLANLLRSAVQFDQLPMLLNHLQTVAQKWYDGYCVPNNAAVTPFTQPWAARLQQMIALLEQIKTSTTALRDEL